MNIKRLAKIMCVLSVLSSPLFSVPVNASSEFKIGKNESILSKGYDVSETLTDEEKRELEFIVNEYDYHPQGKVVSVITSSANKGVDTYTLGKEKVNVTMIVSKINESGYDKFQVGAVGIWNQNYFDPITIGEDGFGISWSDSFVLVSDSTTAYYDDLNGKNRLEFNESKLTTVTPSVGAGWNVPYSIYYQGTRKLGYVKAEVIIRKKDSSGDFNVVANYAHATTKSSVTVGVSSTGPNASVTFSGGYEAAIPAYKAISY